MAYEFQSTNGCARCDAMAGIYTSEPMRPHPNCDCVIMEQSSQGYHEVKVLFDPAGTEVLKDQDPWVVVVRYRVVVHCCSGYAFAETYEREIEVETEWNTQTDEVNLQIENAIDNAIAELIELCPSCLVV